MTKNLIIVIGGNRVGNYETFAPIVNELQDTCNYESLTIFQSKTLLKKTSRNNILSHVFLNKNTSYIAHGTLSLFHNAKLLLKIILLVLRYKNVALLTNKSFNSSVSRLFKKLLKYLSVKTFYTKSFCRAPTKNLRSLLGGKYKINSYDDLCDFALIPTLGHRIEYGLVGYKLNQFTVTGYPKFYPSWRQLLTKISHEKSIVKSEVLFVFSKNYGNLQKVINDVVNVTLSIGGVNRIVLKPHPTTSLSLIQEIINGIKMPSNKSVLISEDNIALLSYNTEIIIAYATSASYDAKIFGKYLINYYDADKDFIDKYRNSELSDIPNFELIESSVLSDFLSNCICYEKQHLKESLLEYFADKEEYSNQKDGMTSDPSNLVTNFL
jgi:hypothetical protein